MFINALARFLNIITQEASGLEELERQVVARLSQRRALIILDNTELLVEAIEANNQDARRLARFLREQLPYPSTSLLAISRSYLGWIGETVIELRGVAPEDGALLFRQNVLWRANEVDLTLAGMLSRETMGHLMSLRLLGRAFGISNIPLATFIEEYEAQVSKVKNKHADIGDHILYASIDISIRYLKAELRSLLSGLWVFHGSFLPETATTIFDPETDGAGAEHSSINDLLHELWQLGLLMREVATKGDETILLYRLPRAIRAYAERYMEQAREREILQARFGTAYAQLSLKIFSAQVRDAAKLHYIASRAYEDLERGISYVSGIEQGNYLLTWGSILRQLGDAQHALELTERALAIAQGQDRYLEGFTLNNLALIYEAIGQPQQALVMLEQALPIEREVGGVSGEGVVLTNMARMFETLEQPQQAFELYDQILQLLHLDDDRYNKAIILSNMARLSRTTAPAQKTLELCEQAIPALHEAGDWVREVNTLENMVWGYNFMKQPQKALEVGERVLSIWRKMHNRANEAITLNTMSEIYISIGQSQRALELYAQILSIWRELGEREQEANVLISMSTVYAAQGKIQQALQLHDQIVLVLRETGNRMAEANSLNKRYR